MTIDLIEGGAELSGRPLGLSPLLFNLLVTLAGRPGRLATREEVKRILWPHAQRIDTDRRLNTAVRALRAALGDEADRPRFIETVRSRGYRWVGRSTRHLFLRPASVAGAGLMAVAGAHLWVLTAQPPEDLLAIMRAQTAVDEWRKAPTAVRFQHATAVVEAAARSGERPAVAILKGHLALEGQWNWRTAEANYRRALALDGTNADALLALAWLQANRGERDAAMGSVAHMLDSASLTEERRAAIGWLLIRIGRPELAAVLCEALPASHLNLLSCAHTAAFASGRAEKARNIGIELMRRVAADPQSIAMVASGTAERGYRLFLDWRARHFLPVDAPRFQKAQVLADAGYRAEALDELAKSVAAHEPLAVRIRSPSFVSLRTDPRFQALAATVDPNS